MRFRWHWCTPSIAFLARLRSISVLTWIWCEQHIPATRTIILKSITRWTKSSNGEPIIFHQSKQQRKKTELANWIHLIQNNKSPFVEDHYNTIASNACSNISFTISCKQCINHMPKITMVRSIKVNNVSSNFWFNSTRWSVKKTSLIKSSCKVEVFIRLLYYTTN